MRHRFFVLGLVIACVVQADSRAAHAAALTWDTVNTSGFQSGNGTWSTSSNYWSTNGTTLAPWVAGDDAVFFNTAGTGASTVTLSGSQSVGNMTFSSSGYTISGGSLAFTSTATITANQAATINSIIQGTSGLNITGNSTLSLGGVNTYTGTTTISGNMTVLLTNSAALGSTASGTTVSGGATLDLNALSIGAEVLTASGAGVGGNGAIINSNATAQINALQSVVMNGNLTVGGVGRFDIRGGVAALNMGGFTLTKTGTNQFSLVGVTVTNPGNITVNQGLQSIEVATNLGGGTANTFTLGGGSLQLYQLATAVPWSLVVSSSNGGLSGGSSVASTNNTWAGPITLNSTLIDNAAAIVTLSGAMSGVGGISKSGASPLVLSGSNSYSGISNVSGGTLQFAKEVSLYGNAPANWTAAKIIVGNGAVLALNVGGAGEFTASDVQSISAIGTSTGGFTNGSFLGLDTTNAAGGNFSYGNVIANTSGGTNAIGLVKLGANTLTLTGSNTYTGGTGVTAGTLNINADAALGAAPGSPATNITFNGSGYLQAGGNLSLSANRNLTISAGASGYLDPGGSTFTIPGALVNSNSTTTLYLANAGTLTLSNTAASSVGNLTLQNGVTANITGPFSITNKFVVGNLGSGVTLNWSGTGGITTPGNFFGVGDGASNNVLNVTSGSLGISLGTGTTNKFFIGNAAGATALSGNQVNVLGGTMSVAAGNPIEIGGVDNYTTNNSSGSLNINGGLFVANSSGSDTITLGNIATTGTGTVSGVLNLTSGTLLTSREITLGTTGSGTRTGTLNFNGGVLQAAGTQAAWISGLTSANIQSGGALILSNTSNLTIPQVLSGVGVLTKLGTGDLYLSGNNTYGGGTTIAAGRLGLSAIAATLGSGTVGVASGGQLYSTVATTLSNTFYIVGDGTNGLDSQPRGALRLDSGTIAAGGSIVLQGNASLGSYNGGTGTFNAPISETGGSQSLSINKSSANSPGIVVLGGANSYTGGTVLFNGITRPTNDLAFSSGSVMINSGANLYPTTSRNIANNIYVAGGAATAIEQGGVSTTATYSGTVSLLGNAVFSQDGGGTMIFNGPLVLNGNILTFVTNGVASISSINGNIAADSGGLVIKNVSPTSIFALGGSNAYTGATQIVGGELRVSSAAALAGSGAINFFGGGLQYSSANTVDYSAQIVSSTSAVTIDTNGQPVSFFTPLSATNTAGFVKAGAGTLTFATSNNYLGATTIAGGELSLGDPGAIPVGSSIIFTGGTLQHTSNNTLDYSTSFQNSTAAIAIDTNGLNMTYSGVIAASNTGGFTKAGAGTLTLGGANAYLGVTTAAGGVLQAGSSGAPFSSGGLAVGAAGMVDLNGFNITVGPLSGAAGGLLTDNLATSGTTTLTVNQGTATSTFSATIQDGASRPIALLKTGSGNLIIANANYYSGGTVISSGGAASGTTNGLTILNSLALGSGPITVGDQVGNGEPSLILGNNVNLSGNPLTLASSAESGGRAYLMTAASNSATYFGPMTLSGDGTTGLYNNGMLSVSGSINGTGSNFQLRGTGTGSLYSTVNIGSIPVNKTDAGSWTIYASGNIWGATTVSIGTLTLGAGNALPTTTVVTMGQGDGNSSTLNLAGFNQAIGGLSLNTTGGTKTVTNSTAFLSTLTINPSGSYNYGGVLSGPIALVFAGTGSQTLSGTANTFTGGVDVQSGTFAIGNAAALSAANGPMAVDGGTLDLAGNNLSVSSLSGIAGVITNSSSAAVASITTTSSASSAFNGALLNGVGAGLGITKAGAGVFTLAGTNNYNGPTNINGGLFVFASTDALPSNFGSVSINSGGALAITGAYSTVTDWQNSLKINTSSLGALALLGDSSENINMASYGGLSLGSTGSVNYSGTLTPAANTYRLGGAGGTITVSSALNLGNTLVVAGGGSSGYVILTNTGNNSFVGGITIASGGTLQGSTETMQGNTADNGAMIFDQADAGTFGGNISGSGTLVKQNAGSVNLTGNSSTYAGAVSVTAGTLSVDPAGSLNFGGAFTASGAGVVLNVGGLLSRTTGAGSLTIDNGAVANFSGTGNIAGSNGAIIVGSVGSGTLNVTSGALTLNPAGTNGFGIGYSNGGSGLLNITGGTVKTGNNVFLVGYGNALSSGTVNISSGGVLSLGNSSEVFVGGGPSGGSFGTGVMNINAGGLVSIGTGATLPNDKLYLAGYGGTGTLNINGGTLATSRGVGTGGTSTVYINGGDVRATATLSSLFAITNAYIQANGATIDTNGFAVTDTQVIKHDPALGATLDGGLLKLGAGTLTLNPGSSNTYTGGTIVNQGTLVLAFGDNTNNVGTIAGPLTVNPGAVVRVTALKGFGFSYYPSMANPLSVTTFTDTYGLLDYTATGGGLGGGQTVYLTGGTIQSNGGVSSSAASGYYRFTTNGLVDDTIYVLASTASSLMAGRIESSQAGGFNVSRGSAAIDLIVSAALTGAGGPMVFSGAGITQLSGSGTFTGGTDIQGGTVLLGNANGLGANTNALAVDGGTLDLKGLSIAVGALSGSGGYITSTSAGTITFTTSSTTSATYSGQLNGGSATLSLVKGGASLEVLAGSNGYTGTTTISAGTLQFNSVASVGGTAASMSVASGAVAAAGYAVDQNFLNRITPASSGEIALAANSGNNLDFSAAGANLAYISLGAVGSQSFSGAITPSGSSYRLGGAGGTINVSSTLTDVGGPTSVLINPNTPVGVVVLSGSSSYSGGTRLSGGTLVVDSDASLGVSTGTVTVAAATMLQAGAPSVLLGAARPVVLNAALTIDPAGNTLNIAGVISGASAITKGPGGVNVLASPLILSGANTFTSGVTINNGWLTVTNSASLGSGNKTITMTNGTNGNPELHLDPGPGGAFTLSSSITYTVSNTSTPAVADPTQGTIVNDSGNNVIAGAITNSSGGGGAILTSNAGSITFLGNFTPNTTSRALVVRGNGAGTYAGVIANGSTVNMPVYKDSGSGTWTFSGLNNYSGPTTIEAGVLSVSQLANGGVLSNIGTSSNSAANLVLGGGALQYTGGAASTDRLFTVTPAGGTIDASGAGNTALLFTNAGAIVSTDAPALVGTESTVTTPNVVQVGGLGPTSNLVAGMTVSGSGVPANTTITAVGPASITLSNSATLSGTATLTFSVANRTLTLTGISAGANQLSGVLSDSPSGGQLLVAKTGPGFWQLAASNGYSGGTSVSGGTLQLGQAAALGTGGLTANAGVVDLAGYSPSLASLSGSAGLITSSNATPATVSVSGPSATTFDGTLADGAGSVALTLNGGNLTLGGTNAFTGGTTVASGNLVLDGASSLLAGSSLVIGAPSPGAVFAPPMAAQASHAVAVNLAPVPEPGTLALLAAAGALVVALRRRRTASVRR